MSTTKNSTLWDIMGYAYHCADIDARAPEFIAESEIERADHEDREPIVICGWRALADDIQAGDDAAPGPARRVGPRVAKRSATRLTY